VSNYSLTFVIENLYGNFILSVLDELKVCSGMALIIFISALAQKAHDSYIIGIFFVNKLISKINSPAKKFKEPLYLIVSLFNIFSIPGREILQQSYAPTTQHSSGLDAKAVRHNLSHSSCLFCSLPDNL